MDATLVIIGLNFRTSPVPVRERFWLSEQQRTSALQELVRCEGIDEVMVLATCTRTEFILWASDATEAANSVLRFLTHNFDLKLSEWSNFYRLVDDSALLHLFRVASGLDSLAFGNSEVTEELRKAWQFAQQQGSTGRFLDAVLQKALAAAQRARNESGLTDPGFALQCAPIAVAMEIFGSLSERKVLLIGAGRMNALSASCLARAGARDITITSRNVEHAQELAAQVAARAIPYSQLLPELQQADIVISATSSHTGYVVSAEELDIVVRSRQNLPLLVVDLSVPRDIDPEVKQITGVHFYDLDDLEGIVERNTASNRVVAETAEQVLLQELRGFRDRLLTENVVPTIVALRHRLEEICGQELNSLEAQFGPFTEDQQHALHSLASHITQRIAGSMARELKGLPEQSQQQQLTEAVQRLFHLELAGHTTSSQHQ